MAATGEQQRLTGALLDELDRIERLISTRDELEDYVAILTQKVKRERFPDAHLLDRLERLLRVLQRVAQEEG